MNKDDRIDDTYNHHWGSESDVGPTMPGHVDAPATDNDLSTTTCERCSRDADHEDAERNEFNSDNKGQKTDIVTWDGPRDPENPKNWSKTRKWLIVATTCLMTFCVTFSSSVFSAAVGATAEEFNTSSEVMVLAVSLFVLGIAISESLDFIKRVRSCLMFDGQVQSSMVLSQKYTVALCPYGLA